MPMRIYPRILVPVVFGLVTVSGGAQSLDLVRVYTDDFTCGDGHRLMSEQFAREHQNHICNMLGDWDFARLAGGGSISGPGNDCDILPVDRREASTSLCMPVEDYSFVRGVLLMAGFRTPQELTDMSPAGWREALAIELGNRTGEDPAFYASLDNIALASFGGLVLYLLKANRDDPAALTILTSREIRRAVRIDVNEQTGIPLRELILLTDLELLSLLYEG